MRQTVFPSLGKQLRKGNMKGLGNRTMVENGMVAASWWDSPPKNLTNKQ